MSGREVALPGDQQGAERDFQFLRDRECVGMHDA